MILKLCLHVFVPYFCFVGLLFLVVHRFAAVTTVFTVHVDPIVMQRDSLQLDHVSGIWHLGASGC